MSGTTKEAAACHEQSFFLLLPQSCLLNQCLIDLTPTAALAGQKSAAYAPDLKKASNYSPVLSSFMSQSIPDVKGR